MKKISILIICSILAGIGMAARDYIGPWDERKPPARSDYDHTLGWLAQVMDVGAVADVVEDGTSSSIDYPYGYLKVHVVNAIYGCTNGQELVIVKEDTQVPSYYIDIDLNFEYHPTNHSRIVFAGITRYPGNPLNRWTPQDWKLPPQPEVIMTPTNNPCILYGFTRSWWYDGYQDNLPYTHLTNLVRAARTDRNWTNYYHICRDAVPNHISSRVWMDSFYDLMFLARPTNRSFYEFMVNDPAFPVECREMQASFADLVIEDE